MLTLRSKHFDLDKFNSYLAGHAEGFREGVEAAVDIATRNAPGLEATNVRPDIKQGWWTASMDIAGSIRALLEPKDPG